MLFLVLKSGQKAHVESLSEKSYFVLHSKYAQYTNSASLGCLYESKALPLGYIYK